MKYNLTRGGQSRTSSYMGTITLENGVPTTDNDIDFVCSIKEECRRRNAEHKKRLEWLKAMGYTEVPGVVINDTERWRWRIRGRKASEVIRNRGCAYCMPLEKATEADVYMFKVTDYKYS